MGKSTHLTFSTSQFARIGGIPVSHRGAQDLQQNGVPSNWFPANLPAASNGTPTNSDCRNLLSKLAPIVANLIIQQSVMLAASYRTVQSGIALGGNMTVNGVSQASGTFFDYGYKIGEAVPVDVINKNPSLLFDLAMRLARGASLVFDGALAGTYSNAVESSAGAQGTTPTAAAITTALSELPVTGEPVFVFLNPATLAAMQSAGNLYPGAAQSVLNDVPAMGGSSLTSAPGAGTRAARFLASSQIGSTGNAQVTNHNLAVLPSFWAMATADMGQNIATNSTAFLAGQTLVASSTAIDPETATPQLAVQLVISNTGAGNQTVFVNAQYAAICINPANGVQIFS